MRIPIYIVMKTQAAIDEICRKSGAQRRLNAAAFTFVKSTTKIRGRRIYIGLDGVKLYSIYRNTAFVQELNNLIDHELVHAFSISISNKKEEWMAYRFSLAGAWARR
jgi:hypothetical protein